MNSDGKPSKQETDSRVNAKDGVDPKGKSISAPHPEEPIASDGEEQPSRAAEVTAALVQFAKTFVIIFPVYALGYFGLSFSWVLIGLVLFFWWRRNRGNKSFRLYRALAFLDQEERSVRQAVCLADLPAWWVAHDVVNLSVLYSEIGIGLTKISKNNSA
ncbi:EST2B protein, partial [Polypterus senegalus]|nr:EST2B protein [Polypterus senegalus]